MFLKNVGDYMLKKTGRIKIFTDQKKITRDNVLSVLRKAYAKHRINAGEIQFLIDYERGEQPLQRTKSIRPDIDIQTNDNLANYIKEFKIGYFWGTPVTYVQRGDKEHHGTDENVDSAGISALNEMIKNGNSIGKRNMELAEFVEIGGIGFRIVENKTDFETGVIPSTYANIYTLDSRNTFCVYYAGIGQPKVMAVTYAKISGKLYFTCITDSSRFEIQGDTVQEYINPFGMINIVEYERSVDRTGCFERQIPLMDNLNVMVSDFANDVAQKTQEIWWGNDIEFPVDEKTGEPIKPKSGQWLLTHSDSGGGQNQKIQPMSSTFDSSSTLNAIGDTRTKILQNAKVPIQYTSEGGGSTGVATDAMTGWSATEVDAIREEQMIGNAEREELKLILKAISFVPTSVLPEDDPIRKVHVSDVDFHFNRRRNYDMAVKANAFATWVAHGIKGRHALKAVDAFEDVEQVWEDSKNGIEEYQRSTYGTNNTSESDRIMSDNSDQTGNSPILDGMNTDNSKQMV